MIRAECAGITQENQSLALTHVIEFSTEQGQYVHQRICRTHATGQAFVFNDLGA